MTTSPSQILFGDAARAAFPQIVGGIKAAMFFGADRAIIDQGAGAFSVVVRGQFRACCPTMRHAVAAMEKAG